MRPDRYAKCRFCSSSKGALLYRHLGGSMTLKTACFVRHPCLNESASSPLPRSVCEAADPPPLSVSADVPCALLMTSSHSKGMRSGAQTSSTVPKKTAAAMPKDAWLINHLPSAGAKSVAASPCFDGRNTEASLMTHYYPRFRSKNKVAVAANAFPEQTTEWRAGDVVGAGKLRVTRWQAAGLPLPQAFPPSAPSVTLTQDIFIYTTSSAPAEGPCSSSSSGSSGSTATAATVPTKAVSSWYPNFAHRFLFAAWNSSLLAQDELQVLEFPVLAAIAQGPTKLTTVDPDGTPTPVLIQGVSLTTLSLPPFLPSSFSRTVMGWSF